jgi:hypothetical protein
MQDLMRENAGIVCGVVMAWLASLGALWGAALINDWVLLGTGLLIVLLGMGLVTGGGNARR